MNQRADETVHRLEQANMVVKLESEQCFRRVHRKFAVHEGFVVADELEVGVQESAVLELVQDSFESFFRPSFHLHVDILGGSLASVNQYENTCFLVVLC